MTTRAVSPHPVRKYVQRVASLDAEEYPEWDLTKPLPKLPVPDLHSTLNNYLLSIKPVVSESKYEQTTALVAEFGRPGGQGEFLQSKLLEFAKAKDNWAYNFWFDDMYMKLRLPLPVNSNPGMVFPRQYFEDRSDQLRFAARLISGILDYKTVLDTRSLPIDRARHSQKGQPLCMEQYYRLFTSYRTPGVTRDSLATVDTGGHINQEPEHVIVICKGQLFVLDVMVNYSRLSVDNLYCQLKRIVQRADDEEKSAERIGILTACDRDRWAKARMTLIQDSTNRDSLDLIERCIFVLCLDQALPLSFNHQNSVDETRMSLRDDVSLAHQMLHGMGSSYNSTNRWFDKTMQFIIGEDGACGLCYEHSASEGIAVVQLIEHLLTYMEEIRRRKLPRLQSLCDLPAPTKLRWTMSQETQREVEQACFETDRMIEDLDLYIMNFTDFGKNFPKSQNMSPDAFIQLALQLTFYEIHHHLVPTYESASIRRFRHGRVDNIRASTVEALAWCRAMTGESQSTDEEKFVLLKTAIKRQTDILLQTILGHGIDNHLLGLREMALTLGLDTPEIFKDESYLQSNHFTLSTSQVPTSTDASFMLYGPVVPRGYGACYNPHPDSIVVCITSFRSSEITSSERFAFTLEDSFKQMKELCQHRSSAQEFSQPRRSKAQNAGLVNGGPVTKNGSGKCGTAAFQSGPTLTIPRV